MTNTNNRGHSGNRWIEEPYGHTYIDLKPIDMSHSVDYDPDEVAQMKCMPGDNITLDPDWRGGSSGAENPGNAEGDRIGFESTEYRGFCSGFSSPITGVPVQNFYVE